MQRALIAVCAVGAAMSAPAGALDFSFEGGTLKEYYDDLQDAEPGLRLVVHPDVDWFMMPAVTLRDVSSLAAVEAAARLHPAVSASWIADSKEPSNTERATFVVTVDPEELAQLIDAELHTRTFDLDFPGGTLESFAAALREASETNVVVQGGAADARVPTMTLRNVSAGNVLQTLQYSGLEGGERFELHSSGGESGAEPLYVLTSGEDDDAGEPELWVGSIEEILEYGTLEASEVLGAVESALDLQGGDSELRFHEPTSLLILRAPEEAILVVQDVVRQAESTAASRSQRD